MPIINGKRVLSNSPEANAVKNARGGINKQSAREARGEVSVGATGTGATLVNPVGKTFAKQPSTMTGSISAPDLAKDQVPTPLTQPVEAPPVDRGVIDKSVQQTGEIVRAGTQEEKDLAKVRAEMAALSGEGSLQDMFTGGLQEAGVPTNLKELQDINTQLAGMGTASMGREKYISRAAGQTMGQAGREISQEKAELDNAIFMSGLAARAQVLQGNIETASNLVNQAVTLAYQDRTLRNTNLINQINDLRGTVDDQTQQILDKKEQEYIEDQTSIQRAQGIVDSAVNAGYASGDRLETLLNIKDPEAQTEYAQQLVANGIQKDIREAKAAAAAAAAGGGGFDAPDLKNFGSSDEPQWKQWNAETGSWEDVTGLDAMGGAGSPEEVQQSLDQFSFLRDTAARILGVDAVDESGEVIKEYDELYKSAGKGAWDRTAGFFTGDTRYNRLDAQVDVLRTNMLTLMTDPNVKQFFGPQMSDADVRLMTAAGTSLRTANMSPEDMKSEVTRIDDLVNRAETAVKNAVEAQEAGATAPVQTNIITAPDGTQIEIVD